MEQQHSYSKLIIGSFIVLLLIGVGAAGAFFVRGKQDRNVAVNGRNDQADRSSQGVTNDTGNQAHVFGNDYRDKCPDVDTANFTSAPLALNDLGAIEPMGKMLDAHVTPTDHVYVAPTNFNAADNTYDVLMPSDGVIVQVDKMPQQQIGDALNGTKTIADDHRIVVAHSCQYYSIFIHVHALSDKLKSVVGQLDWGAQKQTNISLKAGEVIGKIGGNPVDWTLVDTSKELSGFITPSSYAGEPWKIHTIDPLSVYTGTLKTQLIAKSLRTVEPYGGKIDYDKPGALIGTWFKEGTNGYTGANQDRYWDGHLSVVPDYIDTNTTMVSIGNWDGQAKQLAVKGKVDPSTVTAATGPVKYELIKTSYLLPNGQPFNGKQVKGMTMSQQGTIVGTIMFEVQPDEKLKVEKFIGKTANQVDGFTSAAMTYER